mmetsp:Transcript_9851/g.36735  ORF Transcript_9851/g.36735 Transcript_9851/m.36735 type:complete len:393 (-) Transcript_9851:4122-5300(-)
MIPYSKLKLEYLKECFQEGVHQLHTTSDVQNHFSRKHHLIPLLENMDRRNDKRNDDHGAIQISRTNTTSTTRTYRDKNGFLFHVVKDSGGSDAPSRKRKRISTNHTKTRTERLLKTTSNADPHEKPKEKMVLELHSVRDQSSSEEEEETNINWSIIREGSSFKSPNQDTTLIPPGETKQIPTQNEEREQTLSSPVGAGASSGVLSSPLDQPPVLSHSPTQSTSLFSSSMSSDQLTHMTSSLPSVKPSVTIPYEPSSDTTNKETQAEESHSNNTPPPTETQDTCGENDPFGFQTSKLNAPTSYGFNTRNGTTVHPKQKCFGKRSPKWIVQQDLAPPQLGTVKQVIVAPDKQAMIYSQRFPMEDSSVDLNKILEDAKDDSPTSGPEIDLTNLFG